MKSKPKGKLAVFDTFKTKNQDLTGEAKKTKIDHYNSWK